MAGVFSDVLKLIRAWQRFLIVFLTPLILCPLPIIIGTKEARTGYAILIMATYWCTEVTHLSVTALLPLLLFPLLKVLKSSEVAPSFFPDTNFLVLGGLMMAVAIEKWNVHKRIALKVLLFVGAQPRRLMLGFMLVTAFISMWITNTATTAMMTPIMEAVLKELDKEYLVEAVDENENEDENVHEEAGDPESPSALNMTAEERLEEKKNKNKSSESIEFDDLGLSTPSRCQSTKALVDGSTEEDGSIGRKRKRHEQMSKAMMLAICYSANIGGTGTLTGTGPQLVLAGVASSSFEKGPGVSFLDWFVLGCPQMLLFLCIAWLYLQVMFFGIGWKHLCFCFRGNKRNKTKGAETYIVMKRQYDELGPVSFAEFAVLFHFLIMVLFWLLRDPKFIPGWGSLFPGENSSKSYVSDATAGILITFSLFLFPSKLPVVLGGEKTDKPTETLLEWKYTQRNFPWGILLLLGGGFALAKACDKSGLSLWIGCELTALSSIPDFGIALILCILITFLTEFTSNTATATILLPILASLAQNINIHPYYLMLPATVCSSFAFMLPVATPPNAIVFATGRLAIPDMAKAGLGMNLIGIVVVTISMNTIGMAYFGLNKFPSWATDLKGASRCGGAAASIMTTISTNMSTVLPTTN